MKKIACFFALLLCAFQCNDFIETRSYEIINTTEQAITLKFYNVHLHEKPQLIERIELEKTNSESNNRFYFFLGLGATENFGKNYNPYDENNPLYIAAALNDADSVAIIFNNQKFIGQTLYNKDNSYFSFPKERNIFNDENYIKPNRDHSLLSLKNRFEITENDFNNAQNCNGNCLNSDDEN